MKITIELEGRETLDLTEHQLRLLFCDAFAEFQTARGPSESYVNRRYPWMSEEQRTTKVEDVIRRIRTAETIRNGMAGGDITVKTSPVCPQCKSNDSVYLGPDSFRCVACDTSFIN